LIGEDMTYFSLAQFPRSISLQRSLQKGKNSSPRSTGFVQIGHFMPADEQDAILPDGFP